MSAWSGGVAGGRGGVRVKGGRAEWARGGARSGWGARSPTVPGAGAANAAGFHHCIPPLAAEEWWETPANGSPITTRPTRTSSDGCPLCQLMTLLTCEVLTSHFDHAVAHGTLGTS